MLSSYISVTDNPVYEQMVFNYMNSRVPENLELLVIPDVDCKMTEFGIPH